MCNSIIYLASKNIKLRERDLYLTEFSENKVQLEIEMLFGTQMQHFVYVQRLIALFTIYKPSFDFVEESHGMLLEEMLHQDFKYAPDSSVPLSLVKMFLQKRYEVCPLHVHFFRKTCRTANRATFVNLSSSDYRLVPDNSSIFNTDKLGLSGFSS